MEDTILEDTPHPTFGGGGLVIFISHAHTKRKKGYFVTTLPRFAHTYPYLWEVNKLLTKNEPFK